MCEGAADIGMQPLARPGRPGSGRSVQLAQLSFSQALAAETLMTTRTRKLGLGGCSRLDLQLSQVC